MAKKPVFLEGNKIGYALTLTEAAQHAKREGVKVNVDMMASIVQHVGEGPLQFNVVREKGSRIP